MQSHHGGGKLKFILPAIIIICMFVFVPAVIIVITSLFSTNLMEWKFVGLQNYVQMWPNFSIAMKNTVWYILMVPVTAVVITVFLALCLADKPKSANMFRGLFYFPAFSAGLIVGQFWRYFFSNSGIANWIVGRQVSWTQTYGVPVVSFITLFACFGMVVYFTVAISHISTDQFEAAMIDGASWWQIKLRIILPQILPMISIMLLFAIIVNLQMWENLYIVSPFDSSATMMYRVFKDGFQYGRYGIASAECVVMIACVLIIGLVRERLTKHEDK